MRGTGDSDGLYDDEYSEAELDDAVAIIGWIAEQPWSNGAVGMMGISWGGFNSLQVAARRPPALRAIISIASSVDRYNDDIHYRNGCHLGAHLSWATTMLAYVARPPDSDVVGDRWRSMWLERLAAIQPSSLIWMSHQRRDGFWKRGSVGDDFGAIDIPALVVAGWADGYRNTPAMAVRGLGSPSSALNGPWIHKYPHFASPLPRMDFLSDAIAWWNRWLRTTNADADVEPLPQQRAFISSGVRPDNRTREAGRWVSRRLIDGDATTTRLWLTAQSRLADAPAAAATYVSIATLQHCGVAAGEFFVVDPATELPGDQRPDDALAQVFDSEPVEAAIDVLGRPRLDVRVAVDQPQANLIVRLEDVHPDGVSHRVALGMLNLSHRGGNEHPRTMTPGTTELVTLVLDDTGYRFETGHLIRLAISTTYFPYVLPPPMAVTATLLLDATATLDLPTPTDLVDIELAEPVDGLLPVYPHNADGETVHPTNGIAWKETHEHSARIDPHDPLGFELDESCTVRRRRADVVTVATATGRLTASADQWVVEASLTATENGSVVFDRSWTQAIPRDHQ
jgi:putative CocE/NonD family hydrolase